MSFVNKNSGEYLDKTVVDILKDTNSFKDSVERWIKENPELSIALYLSNLKGEKIDIINYGYIYVGNIYISFKDCGERLLETIGAMDSIIYTIGQWRDDFEYSCALEDVILAYKKLIANRESKQLSTKVNDLEIVSDVLNFKEIEGTRGSEIMHGSCYIERDILLYIKTVMSEKFRIEELDLRDKNELVGEAYAINNVISLKDRRRNII